MSLFVTPTSTSEPRISLLTSAAFLFALTHAFLAGMTVLPAQDISNLVAGEGFQMAVPNSDGWRGGSTVLLKNGSILLAYGKPNDIRIRASRDSQDLRGCLERRRKKLGR